MHQRKHKTPLLVKEVILPRGNDSSGLSNNSTFHEITGHRYKKTGQQEAEEVFSLMVLDEKPLENYFEGTRKGKKSRKRKRKNDRTVIPPSELFSDGAQTMSRGERNQTKKGLTKEEKTEIQLLDLKIYEYEKKREQALRKNYVRQKMAEEDYICQMESLAVMWFKTEKRRCATRTVSDDCDKKRTVKESSTSKDCCSENQECPSGKLKKFFKEMCQSENQAQPTENVLVDEFYEKLVFVDEDS